MERRSQQTLEYLNYGMAVAWLLVLALVCASARALRRRHYSRGLKL
jgi:hypothetical protein